VGERRRELWVGGALALVFVVLRALPYATANIGRGLDSFDYLDASRQPLFSRAFLGGPRPWGYPLYLKLLGRHQHLATFGQLVLGAAAWLVLALMVARATRSRRLRLPAAALVLAIGCSLEVIQWDRIVSSESLSIAFGAGLLAALLWLRERWTWPRVALIAALGLAWTAIRDTNGTLLAVVGVVLLAGVVLRLLRRRVAFLAAAFLAIAVLGSLSASSGRRWEGPLKDVVTIRVLESPERTSFLQERGLPLSADEIAAARGRCVADPPVPGCVPLANPEFYRWIADRGRSAYVRMLGKFPATTLWEPYAHARDSVGTRVRVEIGTGSDEHAPVSGFLEAFVFVRNPLLVTLAGVAAVISAAVVLVRRRQSSALLIAFALVALAFPHLWLVWVGGALEVTRHSLLASIQLRLGIWLTLVWLLDHLSVREMRPEPEVQS
jgi:hypothetical protein